MRKFLIVLSIFCSFAFIHSKEKVILGFNQRKLIKNNNYFPNNNMLNSQNHTFLCSVPRTGTNLTASLMVYLTRHPLFWSKSHNFETGIYINRFGIDIEYKKPYLFGTHVSRYLSEVLASNNQFSNNNKLIITLRNFKEVFFRSEKCSLAGLSSHYYGVLSLYDNWNPENKLIVKYEDLIKTPESVINLLSSFLGSNKSIVNKLKTEYTHLKNKSLHSYSIHLGKSKSDAKNPLFHSRSKNVNEIKRIEDFFKTKNPYLYNKYLKQYEID